jgi:hypothetical protein
VDVLIEQIRLGRTPRLVIFYDGANERGRAIPGSYWANLLAQFVDADYGYWDALDAFEAGRRLFNFQHSALWNVALRLRSVFRARVPTAAPEAPLDENQKQVLRNHASAAARSYVTNVALAANLGTAYGFVTLVLLQPLAVCLDAPESQTYRFSGPPQPWQATYYPRLYAEIQRLAQGSNLHVIDLCTRLNPAAAQDHNLFNTYFHLSPSGNSFMASVVEDVMKPYLGP